MGLSKQYDVEMENQKDYDDDTSSYGDFPKEDDSELAHRRQVRKMIEERLERKRLLNELDGDELEDNFNWDDLDR